MIIPDIIKVSVRVSPCDNCSLRRVSVIYPHYLPDSRRCSRANWGFAYVCDVGSCYIINTGGVFTTTGGKQPIWVYGYTLPVATIPTITSNTLGRYIIASVFRANMFLTSYLWYFVTPYFGHIRLISFSTRRRSLSSFIHRYRLSSFLSSRKVSPSLPSNSFILVITSTESSLFACSAPQS